MLLLICSSYYVLCTIAPTWDKLGDKFKGNDNIVISKIDGTANEIDYPGLAVRGFPSIFFFKGDDKTNPVKYEQGRDLDDFVNYLKENAYNKF
jgi:protein disulfide isomerase family A protein 3